MAYANAYVFKNPASVKLDTVEMQDQISKVRLIPDTPTQVNRTFGGVDKDRDTTSWTAEITGYQTRLTGGFGKALDTAIAAGDNIEIVLQFKSGTGQEVCTFTIVPVPAEYGGASGDWNVAEMTFEVVDEPVFTVSA